MKSIALAILAATLAGCAVVPLVPPVYVGARYHSGGYGGGWHEAPPRAYGPYYRY